MSQLRPEVLSQPGPRLSSSPVFTVMLIEDSQCLLSTGDGPACQVLMDSLALYFEYPVASDNDLFHFEHLPYPCTAISVPELWAHSRSQSYEDR